MQSKLEEGKIENLYYETKLEELNLKIEKKHKPAFMSKLTLRDTLIRLYETKVKPTSTDLQLETMKTQ